MGGREGSAQAWGWHPRPVPRARAGPAEGRAWPPGFRRPEFSFSSHKGRAGPVGGVARFCGWIPKKGAPSGREIVKWPREGLGVPDVGAVALGLLFYIIFL